MSIILLLKIFEKYRSYLGMSGYRRSIEMKKWEWKCPNEKHCCLKFYAIFVCQENIANFLLMLCNRRVFIRGRDFTFNSRTHLYLVLFFPTFHSRTFMKLSTQLTIATEFFDWSLIGLWSVFEQSLLSRTCSPLPDVSHFDAKMIGNYKDSNTYSWDCWRSQLFLDRLKWPVWKQTIKLLYYNVQCALFRCGIMRLNNQTTFCRFINIV